MVCLGWRVGERRGEGWGGEGCWDGRRRESVQGVGEEGGISGY